MLSAKTPERFVDNEQASVLLITLYKSILRSASAELRIGPEMKSCHAG